MHGREARVCRPRISTPSGFIFEITGVVLVQYSTFDSGAPADCMRVVSVSQRHNRDKWICGAATLYFGSRFAITPRGEGKRKRPPVERNDAKTRHGAGCRLQPALPHLSSVIGW